MLLLALLLGLQAAEEIDLDTQIAVAAAADEDSAGYLRIVNKGEFPDRLVGVDCTCAEKVEIHKVDWSTKPIGMDTLPELALPAGATVEIRPGGALHLMLIKLRRPLKADSEVELTLHFHNAGSKKVQFLIVTDSKASWALFRARP